MTKTVVLGGKHSLHKDLGEINSSMAGPAAKKQLFTDGTSYSLSFSHYSLISRGATNAMDGISSLLSLANSAPYIGPQIQQQLRQQALQTQAYSPSHTDAKPTVGHSPHTTTTTVPNDMNIEGGEEPTFEAMPIETFPQPEEKEIKQEPMEKTGDIPPAALAPSPPFVEAVQENSPQVAAEAEVDRRGLKRSHEEDEGTV